MTCVVLPRPVDLARALWGPSRFPWEAGWKPGTRASAPTSWFPCAGPRLGVAGTRVRVRKATAEQCGQGPDKPPPRPLRLHLAPEGGAAGGASCSPFFFS